MALTLQKLSLRKKVATPASSVQPEEPSVDSASEAVVEEPVMPKKLITKKIENPVESDDVVDGEAALVEEETPKREAASSATRKLVKVVKSEPENDVLVGEDSLVAYKPMAMGTIDGEISERDLMRPRINMVQANSSDLESKGFTVGQIVLNGEVLIWEKGFDPLSMILMTGRKKFIQRLTDEEYKDGVMPMIFDTPHDAEAAGFETQWQGKEPPTVDPGLFCLFLLEQPEYIEPDPLFSLEFGARRFALAEMKFTGVNYRSSSAGRWLMTQSRTSLVPDTRAYMLGMSCSREKQKSGNIVTVASFKNLGRHKDPKFVDWVLSLG
jgi:hypothetical protein